MSCKRPTRRSRVQVRKFLVNGSALYLCGHLGVRVADGDDVLIRRFDLDVMKPIHHKLFWSLDSIDAGRNDPGRRS
jgi:hypothetical protein